MPHEVIMPALGMAQDTGLIVAWHKAEGASVAKGDTLFEVETDKATMEVEAQADGFLTAVRAKAGAEVPVGQVIAVISESAEKSVAATSDDVLASEGQGVLPEGETVIMPALGMAQETGLIVAWHKAPGDAVAATDILFEVETDKSTMEVEAGHDGFVAALLAEAGEEAPVGETIAIISPTQPADAVRKSRSGKDAAPTSDAKSAPATTPEPPRPSAPKSLPKKPNLADNGRILASPKARRLALEHGLDLNRLVAAGIAQPFHTRDIETLKALPAETVAAHAATLHLTANVPSEGLTAFVAWAAEVAGLSDAPAILAGLAGNCLDAKTTLVACETFGQRRHFAVPRGVLSTVTEAEAATPDLILRDLRASRITGLRLGPEEAPVISLAAKGDGLTLTLECAPEQLAPGNALALLNDFAGRLEQPLRHLL